MLSARNKHSLRHAVEALKEHLASGAVPPFKQMSNLFSYGNPEFNGLEDFESKSSQQFEAEWRKRDVWDQRHSPEAVRATLELWLGLMDGLREYVGNVREPVAAEVNFVSRLAFYWRSELKARIQNTRGKDSRQHSGSRPFEQKGLFADFVRKAAELLPDGFKQVRWVHAITVVLSSKREAER